MNAQAFRWHTLEWAGTELGQLFADFEMWHARRRAYVLAAAAGVGDINAPMIHRNGRKNPIQNIQ